MKCKTCLEKYCEDCGVLIAEASTSTPDKENYWRIDVDGSKSTQDIYEECKKLFPCWKYGDLSTITDDRIESYTVYFNKNIEADEEFKKMSADQLKEKGIQSITLKERLLLEIQYFKETGRHLDIDNVTLCAGSRFSGGGVPSVDWDGGVLDVDWYLTGSTFDTLRTRQVVSINP